jgi:hypothetical protein
MLKIATHNSGTGEPSKNWVHCLFTPFSKCQDKTIKEQLESGVRYFDFRVNKNLMLCHGLWESKTSLDEALKIINEFPDITYYRVVIERKNANYLLNTILQNTVHRYKRTRLTEIIQKKPIWKTLTFYRNVPVKMNFISVPTLKEYLTLSHKDWKRYIPIPRILSKYSKYEFNEDTFTMVDFI